MGTNKIVLKEASQFMADYQPTYTPLYAQFLGNSLGYPIESGTLDFKRLQAVSDLHNKVITPKDTEIKQIAVMQGKKTFKRFYKASQFAPSFLQDQSGAEDIVRQVLDAQNLQFDISFLTGDGTSDGDVLNNGLFYSADPNYVKESSTVVATGSKLQSLHSKVVTTAEDSKLVSGEKLVLFYGASIIEILNGVYADGSAPFKSVLAEVLGGEFSIGQIPAQAGLSGQGWIIVNKPQTKLHYSALPSLLDSGYNAQDMQYWFNFLSGSMMLDVLVKGAVIHQPCTIA